MKSKGAVGFLSFGYDDVDHEMMDESLGHLDYHQTENEVKAKGAVAFRSLNDRIAPTSQSTFSEDIDFFKSKGAVGFLSLNSDDNTFQSDQKGDIRFQSQIDKPARVLSMRDLKKSPEKALEQADVLFVKSKGAVGFLSQVSDEYSGTQSNSLPLHTESGNGAEIEKGKRGGGGEWRKAFLRK